MSARRSASLTVGIALCLVGAVLFLGPVAGTAFRFAIRAWPALVVALGVGCLVGFAARRRPASPVPGAMLLALGSLLFLFTMRVSANPLELYGRWWPVLVGTIAISELLRYYSHGPGLGGRPRIVTPGRLALVAAVAVSGLAAGRIAEANPNLVSGVRMPSFVEHMRDELFGEMHEFAPMTASTRVAPGTSVTLSHRFGNVALETADGDRFEVVVTPRVKAYERAAAEAIASRLTLDLVESPDLVVRTNVAETGGDVRSEMRVRVPHGVSVRLSQHHGDVSATGLDLAGGVLRLDANHAEITLEDVRAAVEITGSHDEVEIKRGEGSLMVRAPHTDVSVHGFKGDVELLDVGDAELRGVVASRVSLGSINHARVSLREVGAPTGDAVVTLSGRHTRFSLTDVAAHVRVETSHGSLSVKRLTGDLDVSGEHTEVDVAGVGAVSIVTSRDDVEVRDPSGAVDIKNSFGGIDLRLPRGRAYRISPKIDHGDIRIDSDVESAGADAITINLQTSYDDITVRPSSRRAGGGDS